MSMLKNPFIVVIPSSLADESEPLMHQLLDAPTKDAALEQAAEFLKTHPHLRELTLYQRVSTVSIAQSVKIISSAPRKQRKDSGTVKKKPVQEVDIPFGAKCWHGDGRAAVKTVASNEGTRFLCVEHS